MSRNAAPSYPTLTALYAAIESDRDVIAGTGELGRFVPGEGPIGAPLALVGERPGDREDLEGHPFVGPAGALLDTALAEAGIDRTQVFVTNAIKRFRFVLRGKRRIHQPPNAGEIDHARWWLAQELAIMRPRVVVTLGATALRVSTGARRLGPVRGLLQVHDGSTVLATVHPAYLQRLREKDVRDAERQAFVADLAQARQAAAQT